MRLKLAIVAVLFILTGFGMIHSPSLVMEYISIAMIGLGTSYLIFLILTSGKDQTKEEN